MKFDKLYQQLNEALSDQPMFVHDNHVAGDKWARIRNAVLTNNETIQIHLEDGTRVDMPLKGPNPNYRLILNDGTLTDAFTVAGIFGLLQAPKVLAEDDGGGAVGGGGSVACGSGGDSGGAISSGAGMGVSASGSSIGGTNMGTTDSVFHTCNHNNYGYGYRGPVFFGRAPYEKHKKHKRKRIEHAPSHFAASKKSNTSLKPSKGKHSY